MAKAKTEATEKSKDQLLSEAYNAATRRLRDNHKGEFNTYYSEEAGARGVEWSPRPTKEEKALADIEKLIADNPNLADALRKRLTPEPVITGV